MAKQVKKVTKKRVKKNKVPVVIHHVAQSFTVPFGIQIPTSALIAV